MAQPLHHQTRCPQCPPLPPASRHGPDGPIAREWRQLELGLRLWGPELRIVAQGPLIERTQRRTGDEVYSPPAEVSYSAWAPMPLGPAAPDSLASDAGPDALQARHSCRALS